MGPHAGIQQLAYPGSHVGLVPARFGFSVTLASRAPARPDDRDAGTELYVAFPDHTTETLYTDVNLLNRQNTGLCLVFPMGTEAHPFLQRVEVKRRWTVQGAVHREAYFEGKTIRIVRCGIGPKKAARAIGNLDMRPAGIIAIGAAGALVPGLAKGDVVISSGTVSTALPKDPLPCDSELIGRVSAACGAEGKPVRAVRIATVSRPVFSAEARSKLHLLTGAEAVDMESHSMAKEASAMGAPFVALRVISDDFSHSSLARPGKLRDAVPNPTALKDFASRAIHWMMFVREFKATVALLPPLLVRLVRDWPIDGSR